MFDGKKPKFEQIKKILNKISNNGIVDKIKNVSNGFMEGTVEYRSAIIKGKKVWLRQFITKNGIVNILNAGVLK